MENLTEAAYKSKTTLSAEMATVFVVLNIFLSVVASLGNTLMLIALHKVTSLHEPTKLLFRCLAVTDLCVGCISQPLAAIFYLPYITEVDMDTLQYAVDVNRISSIIFCVLSMYISAAISVDRFLALFLGLRYRQVVTLRRVWGAIVCCSCFSVAIGLLYIFLIVKLVSLALAVGTLTLSVVISISCYIKICLGLRRHQAHVQNMPQAQQNGGEIPLNIAGYKKTVASIAWVQLALVVCYLPFGIVFLKRFIFRWKFSEASHIVWFLTMTLMYSNSSLNPFLYCWKIYEMRQAVKNTIKQFCCLSA